MKKWLVIVSMLLAGCGVNNMDVQEKYTEQRDSCQDTAEKRLDYFAPPDGTVGEQAKKAQLFSFFKRCMQDQGWSMGKDVAVPQPAAEPIGEPGWRKFGYGVSGEQPQQAAPAYGTPYPQQTPPAQHHVPAGNRIIHEGPHPY